MPGAATRAQVLKQQRAYLKSKEVELSALEMNNARRRAVGGRLSKSDTDKLMALRRAVRAHRAEIARLAAGGSLVFVGR